MLVDTLALKLHVDNGRVWTCRGAEHPIPTELTVRELIAGDLLDKVENVCVVGSHQNAELIVGLQEQKLKNRIKSVQVVTPLVCSTAADRARPEAVIYHMRRYNKAPSLGGYHEVTDADYMAYALIVEMQRVKSANLTDKARHYLTKHPAWRSMTFVRGLCDLSCAKLLATIIDPRWYVDLCNPNRGSKLEAYLGLTPKTQQAVTYPGTKPWRHHDKCKLVKDCWCDPEFSNIAYAAYSANQISICDTDTPGLNVRDFLWRIWASYLGLGEAAIDPVKAELRAGQKFVNFVRLTWLAELYRDHNYDGGASLFRATDFFLHVVEAQAYNHYILNH